MTPPISIGAVRKIVGLVLAAAVTAAAALGAARLTLPADSSSSVRRQLAFLRAELEAGAAGEAQRQFPEGYFFLYALYGLTAVDLGRAEPVAERADEAAAARWALEHLDSAEGRQPFAAELRPSYGVFYRGWSNWLRGGLLALEPGDAAVRQRFEDDSAELGAAFDESPTPFLAAYPGQAWPVDSVVAMASLALHDRLLPPRFETTAIRWVANVRAGLDQGTALIPHTADVDTGLPTSGARGTSQSIIHRFLPQIDPEFAGQQYARFRTLFLAAPLGLGPAVREYPRGTDGPADVDSGPLPLGISLSATAVTIGAAKAQGDESLADALARFGEVAGLPLDTPSTRRYAFGLLPIGDAFLAWSKSAPVGPGEPSRLVSRAWQLPLLTLFLLIAAAPWLLRAAWRRRGASDRL